VVGGGWSKASPRELKIFEAGGNVGGGLQLEGDAKKSDAKTNTFGPLPHNRQQAKNILRRFQNEAKDLLAGSHISDNVGQHAMKGTGPLSEERWFGTEEEERDWCAHFSLCHFRTDPFGH